MKATDIGVDPGADGGVPANGREVRQEAGKEMAAVLHDRAESLGACDCWAQRASASTDWRLSCCTSVSNSIRTLTPGTVRSSFPTR